MVIYLLKGHLSKNCQKIFPLVLQHNTFYSYKLVTYRYLTLRSGENTLAASVKLTLKAWKRCRSVECGIVWYEQVKSEDLLETETDKYFISYQLDSSIRIKEMPEFRFWRYRWNKLWKPSTRCQETRKNRKKDQQNCGCLQKSWSMVKEYKRLKFEEKEDCHQHTTL